MNMPLVLLNRRRRGNVFTPSGLFALAEPGVWYDPSDLTTLFQDTAGTTPVTTPGQTVALALDKSKGLVLGSELSGSVVINVTGGSYPGDIGGKKLTLRNSDSSQRYRLQLPSTAFGGSGFLRVSFTSEAGGGQPGAVVDVQGTSLVATVGPGTYTYIVNMSSGDFFIQAPPNNSALISNLSIRKIEGNHATQSTAASRPTYGIVPSGGRRNLLTRTEEFDNAAWVVSTGGVGTVTKSTTNAGTAPDGTTTADRVIFSLNGGTTATDLALLRQAATAPAGSATHSVYLRSFDGVSSYVMQITGADGNASNITVTPDWQRFSISATSPGTPINFGIRLRGGQTPANSNAADILIWGAQLETGSTATAYQRVGSAFDVTEAGVASLSYLSFDGVDDFLVTPTITPGVDKAQVFAGVRKLSDAAVATIAEHSINSGSTPGTWGLFASGYSAGGAAYAANLFGSQRSSFDATTFTSPTTNVLSATFDIAQATRAAEIGFKVNGSVPTLTGGGFGDAGTGNFTAQAIYIGRRNGTVFPFNGNIFSLVVRFGANLDASTITNTERWVGGKTGVTIA